MAQLISIGEIISSAWHNLTDNLKLYVEFAGWGMLFGVLLWLSSTFLGSFGLDAELTSWIAAAISLPISFGFTLMLMAVTWSSAKTLDGRSADFREAIGVSLHKFLSYAWINLLLAGVMAIAIVLTALCFLPPGYLAYRLSGQAAPSLLFLAFLPCLPALLLPFWFYLRYHFAVNALIVDDRRGLAALASSRSIVSGRFWAVFVRFFAPTALFLIGTRFVIYLLLLIAGSILGDPRLFFNPIVEGTTAALVYSLLMNIIIYAVYLMSLPLFVAADLILWQDLKRTAE